MVRDKRVIILVLDCLVVRCGRCYKYLTIWLIAGGRLLWHKLYERHGFLWLEYRLLGIDYPPSHKTLAAVTEITFEFTSQQTFHT